MTNPRFPSNMRIDSPKIDSIDRTAKRISNWLHNDFREVIKPLQVLPEIPGILSDFQEKMVEQLGNQIVAQIMAQMKIRQANIQVAESKAEFLEGRVERERTLLDQQRESVNARYGDMLERSAGEHSSFLSQLDGHAFQIVDDIYPNQINEKVVSQSHPFWAQLATHAFESAFARSLALKDGCDEAERPMSEFLRDSQIAFAEIEALDSGIEEGEYEIPYWYGVFENENTGGAFIDVVFADELQDSDVGDLLTMIALEAIESQERAAPDGDSLKRLEASAALDGELAPEYAARLRKHCERLTAETPLSERGAPARQ